MTAAVTIHPQHILEPGRYLLDSEGRLHPARYRGFIRAVAIVHVKCKPPANVEDEFVVVLNMDATGLPLQPYTEPAPVMPAIAQAIVDATDKPDPVVAKVQRTPQPPERPEPEKPKPVLASPERGQLKRGRKPQANKQPVPIPRPAPRSTDIKTKADGLALFGKVSARVADLSTPTARRIDKPAEPFDAERYAAARERERQAKVKSIKLPPMVRAWSPEACSMCGASGRNGCDHYLPFEG
jgi:hypothetical protein